jgi:transposase
MRPKVKLVDEAGYRAVQEALSTEAEPARRQRLQAVKLAYGGAHSLEEIAHSLGCARSAVIKWLGYFRAEGISGLRERRSDRAQIDPQSVQQLLEGLRLGRWKRAKDIRTWLQGRGVKMKLSGVYTWLRRHGAKPKVPRKSHVKKDPAKATAFKANLAAELTQLGLPAGAKVRLWVADEHRYGLISVVRKVWSLRGCQPTAPYHTKYQWGYLYSALEVDGEGCAEALFTPTVNLEWSAKFLEQIAQSDLQAEHIVIWDQAGFHQKKDAPDLPSRIHILSLPPYSPELNPVEKLGDLIKDRIGNTAWNTIREIEKAIEEELRPIWQMPERVRQLIGEGWLLDQTNATSNL